MNDSPRKVSPLRQRMIEEMRMRQLAPKTRDAYIRAVLHFTRFLGRSPDTATANVTTQRWARREKQLQAGVNQLLGIGGEIQGLAQQELPMLEMELPEGEVGNS